MNQEKESRTGLIERENTFAPFTLKEAEEAIQEFKQNFSFVSDFKQVLGNIFSLGGAQISVDISWYRDYERLHIPYPEKSLFSGKYNSDGRIEISNYPLVLDIYPRNSSNVSEIFEIKLPDLRPIQGKASSDENTDLAENGVKVNGELKSLLIPDDPELISQI